MVERLVVALVYLAVLAIALAIVASTAAEVVA